MRVMIRRFLFWVILDQIKQFVNMICLSLNFPLLYVNLLRAGDGPGDARYFRVDPVGDVY